MWKPSLTTVHVINASHLQIPSGVWKCYNNSTGIYDYAYVRTKFCLYERLREGLHRYVCERERASGDGLKSPPYKGISRVSSLQEP